MSIKNVLIGSILILLIFALSPFLLRQNTSHLNSAVATPTQVKPVKIRSVKPQPKKDIRTSSETSSEYYQVIIDNNIFRPLGWRPPQKKPQYTLIGTTINTDGSNAKAFILERLSSLSQTVKVGDTFGNATVKEILPKKVTLQEDGKEIVLQCGRLQFLR